MGEGPGAIHVITNPRVALEVHIDIAPSFAAIQMKLSRQTEGRHTVNQTKIDGLGFATLLRGNTVECHAKDFRRGGAVHIEVFPESGEQSRIFGEVRHDPQFNLRIVRCNDAVSLRGNKSLANAPTFLGADRDVLKVRGRR